MLIVFVVGQFRHFKVTSDPAFGHSRPFYYRSFLVVLLNKGFGPILHAGMLVVLKQK